ncbi:fluoride efflux transporter CrcB [Jeotgalibacillus aurantiacus]|uniref:fluoride efflux transporter CrcB n=1 Tax=Jeotgalibacillus aurantiacus TaxID=2763266 RepID=UPI001D0B563B|nr:fluoride efflux transporter CrcB [Jeotgalibacillus aurantiacus]
MTYIWIGMGGAIGSMLRYITSLLLPPVSGFPLGTLTVNLIGCLILGFLSSQADTNWSASPQVKMAIKTGLIGSFTTMSAVSTELVVLLQSERYGIALLYFTLSLLGGLCLAALGMRLGNLTVNRRKVK